MTLDIPLDPWTQQLDLNLYTTDELKIGSYIVNLRVSLV
jgi:hypothetical protein